jgi:hypothetical protein
MNPVCGSQHKLLPPDVKINPPTRTPELVKSDKEDWSDDNDVFTLPRRPVTASSSLPVNVKPVETVVPVEPMETVVPAPSPVCVGKEREIAEVIKNCILYPQPHSVFPGTNVCGGFNLYREEYMIPLADVVVLAGRVVLHGSTWFVYFSNCTMAKFHQHVPSNDVFFPTMQPYIRTEDDVFFTLDQIQKLLRDIWVDARSESFEEEILIRMIAASTVRDKPKLPFYVHSTLEENMVGYLNRYFCFVYAEGGDPYVIEERAVPDIDSMKRPITRTMLVTRKLKQLEQAYQRLDYKIPTEGKKGTKYVKRSPFKIWTEHVHQRKAERVVYDPVYPDRPGIYNTFRGHQIKREHVFTDDVQNDPVTREDIEVFVAHIRNVWCGGDRKISSVVLGWFANIVQRPGHKLPLSIVLYGLEGSGKGLPIQIVGAILGNPAFFSTTDINRVLGNFTTKDSDKHLLSFCDEALFVGDHQSQSRFKGLISEGKKDNHQKYKDAEPVQNFTSYIFASNHHRVMRVENSNRRNILLHTKTDHEPNSAYFKRLAAVRPESIAWYLYNLDLACINFDELPHTDYERQQKEMSLTSSQQWWLHCLKTGSISHNTPFSTSEDGMRVPTAMFKAAYDEWYDKNQSRLGPGSFRSSGVVSEFHQWTKTEPDPNLRMTISRADDYDDDWGEVATKERLRATFVPSHENCIKVFKAGFLKDANFEINHERNISTFARYTVLVDDEPLTKKPRIN